MKQLALALTLALAAAVAALVLAPLLVQLVLLFGGTWAPPSLLRVAAHVAYETALWGTGLALWFAARRLRWLTGLVMAVVLVAAAPAAETALAFALGLVTPGFSTTTGFITRGVVGSVALVVASLSARRQPPNP